MKKTRSFFAMLLVLLMLLSAWFNLQKSKAIFKQAFGRTSLSSVFEGISLQEQKNFEYNVKRKKYLKDVKAVNFICYKGSEFVSIEKCSNEFSLIRSELAPILVKYKTDASTMASFFSNGMYSKALVSNEDTEYIAAYFEEGVYPKELLKLNIYPYIVLNRTDYVLRVGKK